MFLSRPNGSQKHPMAPRSSWKTAMDSNEQHRYIVLSDVKSMLWQFYTAGWNNIVYMCFHHCFSMFFQKLWISFRVTCDNPVATCFFSRKDVITCSKARAAGWDSCAFYLFRRFGGICFAAFNAFMLMLQICSLKSWGADPGSVSQSCRCQECSSWQFCANPRCYVLWKHWWIMFVFSIRVRQVIPVVDTRQYSIVHFMFWRHSFDSLASPLERLEERVEIAVHIAMSMQYRIHAESSEAFRC